MSKRGRPTIVHKTVKIDVDKFLYRLYIDGYIKAFLAQEGKPALEEPQDYSCYGVSVVDGKNLTLHYVLPLEKETAEDTARRERKPKKILF